MLRNPRRGGALDSSAASEAETRMVFPPSEDGVSHFEVPDAPNRDDPNCPSTSPGTGRLNEVCEIAPLFSTAGRCGGRPIARRCGTPAPSMFVGTSGDVRFAPDPRERCDMCKTA